MTRRTPKYTASGLARFVAFDEAAEEETITVSLPENLSELSVEEINELRGTALEAFAELQGIELSDAVLNAMTGLNDIRVALDAELASRASVATSRAAQAAALAAQMNPTAGADSDEDEGDDLAGEEDPENEEDPDSTEEEPAPEEGVPAEEDPVAESEVVAEAEAILADAPELIAASGDPIAEASTFQRGPISVPRIRSRQTPVEAPAVTTPRSAYRAAVNVPGLVPNADMDLTEVSGAFAEMVERAGRNSVRAPGSAFSNRHQIAHIVREFDPRAIVGEDNDADAAIAFATNPANIPGGSLTAAGGWCAPSETSYDLCELESRDGIISVPEVQLNRGGLRFTLGPDWADIFNDTGFCFTEAQDIAGDYVAGGGANDPKPTNIVPCPSFTDVRLDACGVTIQAGNLMNRAYPELIRRYVSGAITAHYHRVATNVISRMVAQSTAVSPTQLATPSEAAALAPLLSAIELQAEDIKYRRRMGRGTTLEAVFPFWVRGVIRADLSRRLGVDMLNVTDAMISSWFSQRGISPQFVYNWQNLGAPGAALVWPATVQFLMYPVGTFVKGASPLITIEMLHDSTLNSFNNFTAIFTEEAYNVMKRCHEARVITVPICGAGSTNLGAALDCSA